ncbi:MAG: hypothetical protein KME05_14140 [Gloeocapsa sp. UFS-A4-WI-NPMV-4B04]|jgi:predicted DNA-binding protein YlxM (UPF0122 family)|nr:hypothetical protein [Gloeocapsa sp. UFS-A4-WI-NPMV-4B04]
MTFFEQNIPTSDQLKSISKIADLKEQVKALIKLASDLSPSQSEVFQEALETTKEIVRKGPDAYAQFLDLLPKVPGALSVDFLELIASIEDGEHNRDSKRFQTLVNILPTISSQLSNTYQQEFLRQVLDVLKAINNCNTHQIKYTLLQIFGVLVPQIALHRSDLVTQACLMAKEAHGEVQVQLFTLLVPFLDETKRSEVLQESLRMAEGLLWGGQDRATEALVALVPQLYRFHADLFKQAMQVAQSQPFQGWDTHYRVLMSLVLQFPQAEHEDFVQEALKVARQFSNKGVSSYRGARLGKPEALVALIPYLSDSRQQAGVIQEALTFTRESDWHRTKFLLEVLPYLSDPQQSLEVLQEALAAVLLPSERKDQAKALRLCVSHIPHNDVKLQQQALEMARRIEHEAQYGYIALPLADLASLLRGSQQLEVIEETLWITRQSQNKDYQVKVLTILAPLLPYSQRLEILQEALNHISQFGHEYEKPQAIANLAPLIPQDHVVLLRQILIAAQGIQDTKLRAKAFLSLVPHFPISSRSVFLQQALEVTQQMGQDKDKSHGFEDCLVNISSQLSPFQPELLQQALAITGDSNSIKALTILAPLLSSYYPELISDALDIISRSSHSVEAINTLAVLASCLLFSQVELVNKVLYIIDPASSLKNADKYFGSPSPPRQESINVLATLVSRLLPSQKELIDRAIAIGRGFDLLQDQAKALAGIASHLSEPERTEKLDQALELIITRRPVHISLEAYSAYLQDKNTNYYHIYYLVDLSLEDLQDIEENSARKRDVEALVSIMPCLYEPKRSQVIQKTLDFMQELLAQEDLHENFRAYSVNRDHILKFVLNLAEIQHSETPRALELLTPYERYLDYKSFFLLFQLPETQRFQSMQKVWISCLKNLVQNNAFERKEEKIEELTKLISYFPISQQSAVLQQALDTVPLIYSKYETQPLVALAYQFPEVILPQFLEKTVFQDESLID